MKTKQLIWSGLFIWLIPLFMSLLWFPLFTFNHPLFQALMSLTLVLSILIIAIPYRNQHFYSFKQALFLGMSFLGISVFLDISIFLFGPIRMTLTQFTSEIGVSYLLIPLIFISTTYIKVRRERR